MSEAGEVVAEVDDEAATRVESASDVPSASSIREAPRPASELIRARLAETGDGGRLGRYLILRLLGEGGMGMVFAAYDEDLDRRVAIKLLRTDGPAARLDKRVLLAEAKAMARLSHPNVVQIYDVGEFGEQVFVAMELVNGASLRDWLKERPRSVAEIVRAFVEAGRGLQAVHDAGLVHRDFKPQNVLVSADGRVRVLDFGLAFAQAGGGRSPGEGDGSASGAAAGPGELLEGGTPAFMAPEQHAGGRIDARTDQFSFCVALYQALYGQRPFAGKGKELAAAVLAGEVRVPPADARAPAWLRRVVLRGLSRDPAQRWPSMAALTDTLGRDPWRLRLGVLAGFAVFVALAAALGAVAYYRARAEEQAARVCDGGAERLSAVWSPERRAAAEAAFRATGVVFAESTWSKVQARLDRFGDAWVAAHRGACEDHRRGELSASLYDRSSACLDAARRDLGALVQVFASADAAAVEKAVRATERLPNVERCVDREALAAAVRPPDSPEVAAVVEALRDAIAPIRADLLISRTARCAEIPGLVDRARSLEYVPSVAEAHVAESLCAETQGDYEAAVAALRAAIQAGVASGHDVVVVDALVRVIHVASYRLGRFAEARIWLELAEAFVARLGGRDALRTGVLRSRGVLLLTMGQPGEALPSFGEAIAQLERGGAPTTELFSVLNNRATAHAQLGDRASAAADLERAVRVSREVLGADHPDVALVMSNLGNSRAANGDIVGAEAILHEALAVKERLVGAVHPDLAPILTNIGALHERRGELAEAQAVFERVLEIRERALGPDHPGIATALANIAEVHNERGTPELARPMLVRALAIQERAERPDHPQVAGVLARLGRSELALGRAAEALLHLERSAAIYAANDLRAEEASYTDFYLARARWATARTDKDRARARELAVRSLAGANREVLSREIAALEAWLASIDAEAAAKRPATSPKSKKKKTTTTKK